MIEYTQQQVLEDIKAIAENREYDIKLPLRVLKREQPEAYWKAYQKAYWKALFELKKKHANDFQKLLGKVQLNERGLD